MGNPQSPIRKPRWRWLAFIVLLIALAFGVLHSRNRSVPLPPTSPLIGSWTMPNPQGPGTSRMLTIMSNGKFTSTDFSEESGESLQYVQATLRVEGQTIVFRKNRQGIASLLDSIPGMGPAEDRIPILSISEGELLVGNRDAPNTYTRTSNKIPLTEH